MAPATHAEAIVVAWHKRLVAGALPRPSPTIATALSAGYGALDGLLRRGPTACSRPTARGPAAHRKAGRRLGAAVGVRPVWQARTVAADQGSHAAGRIGRRA